MPKELAMALQSLTETKEELITARMMVEEANVENVEKSFDEVTALEEKLKTLQSSTYNLAAGILIGTALALHHSKDKENAQIPAPSGLIPLVNTYLRAQPKNKKQKPFTFTQFIRKKNQEGLSPALDIFIKKLQESNLRNLEIAKICIEAANAIKLILEVQELLKHDQPEFNFTDLSSVTETHPSSNPSVFIPVSPTTTRETQNAQEKDFTIQVINIKSLTRNLNQANTAGHDSEAQLTLQKHTFKEAVSCLLELEQTTKKNSSFENRFNQIQEDPYRFVKAFIRLKLKANGLLTNTVSLKNFLKNCTAKELEETIAMVKAIAKDENNIQNSYIAAFEALLSVIKTGATLTQKSQNGSTLRTSAVSLAGRLLNRESKSDSTASKTRIKYPTTSIPSIMPSLRRMVPKSQQTIIEKPTMEFIEGLSQQATELIEQLAQPETVFTAVNEAKDVERQLSMAVMNYKNQHPNSIEDNRLKGADILLEELLPPAVRNESNGGATYSPATTGIAQFSWLEARVKEVARRIPEAEKLKIDTIYQPTKYSIGLKLNTAAEDDKLNDAKLKQEHLFDTAVLILGSMEQIAQRTGLKLPFEINMISDFENFIREPSATSTTMVYLSSLINNLTIKDDLKLQEEFRNAYRIANAGLSRVVTMQFEIIDANTRRDALLATTSLQNTIPAAATYVPQKTTPTVTLPSKDATSLKEQIAEFKLSNAATKATDKLNNVYIEAEDLLANIRTIFLGDNVFDNDKTLKNLEANFSVLISENASYSDRSKAIGLIKAVNIKKLPYDATIKQALTDLTTACISAFALEQETLRFNPTISYIKHLGEQAKEILKTPNAETLSKSLRGTLDETLKTFDNLHNNGESGDTEENRLSEADRGAIEEARQALNALMERYPVVPAKPNVLGRVAASISRSLFAKNQKPVSTENRAEAMPVSDPNQVDRGVEKVQESAKVKTPLSDHSHNLSAEDRTESLEEEEEDGVSLVISNRPSHANREVNGTGDASNPILTSRIKEQPWFEPKPKLEVEEVKIIRGLTEEKEELAQEEGEEEEDYEEEEFPSPGPENSTPTTITQRLSESSKGIKHKDFEPYLKQLATNLQAKYIQHHTAKEEKTANGLAKSTTLHSHEVGKFASEDNRILTIDHTNTNPGTVEVKLHQGSMEGWSATLHVLKMTKNSEPIGLKLGSITTATPDRAKNFIQALLLEVPDIKDCELRFRLENPQTAKAIFAVLKNENIAMPDGSQQNLDALRAQFGLKLERDVLVQIPASAALNANIFDTYFNALSQQQQQPLAEPSSHATIRISAVSPITPIVAHPRIVTVETVEAMSPTALSSQEEAQENALLTKIGSLLSADPTYQNILNDWQAVLENPRDLIAKRTDQNIVPRTIGRQELFKMFVVEKSNDINSTLTYLYKNQNTQDEKELLKHENAYLHLLEFAMDLKQDTLADTWLQQLATQKPKDNQQRSRMLISFIDSKISEKPPGVLKATLMTQPQNSGVHTSTSHHPLFFSGSHGQAGSDGSPVNEATASDNTMLEYQKIAEEHTFTAINTILGIIDNAELKNAWDSALEKIEDKPTTSAERNGIFTAFLNEYLKNKYLAQTIDQKDKVPKYEQAILNLLENTLNLPKDSLHKERHSKSDITNITDTDKLDERRTAFLQYMLSKKPTKKSSKRF